MWADIVPDHVVGVDDGVFLVVAENHQPVDESVTAFLRAFY